MIKEKNQIKITEIRLNEATFKNSNASIKPTNVNFFLGRNGSGKTTISRILADASLRQTALSWKPGTDTANTDIQVFNEDYIEKIMLLGQTGVSAVFTIGDSDVTIEKEIEEKGRLLEDSKQQLEHIKTQIESKNAEISGNTEKYAGKCWDIFKADDAQMRTQSMFNRGVSASFFEQLRNEPSMREHKEEELRELYSAAFENTVHEYNPLTDISFPDFHELEELLSEPYISKSDSQFNTFMKDIGASDWVEKGLNSYSHNPGDPCPFCQRPLTVEILKEIEECFDNTHKEAKQKATAFYTQYKSAVESVNTILEKNTSDWYAKNDKSYYVSLCGNIKSTLNSNLSIIENKCNHLSESLHLNDIKALFSEHGEFVETANISIAQNNAIARGTDKKAIFKQAYRENMVYECREYIADWKDEDKKLHDELEPLQSKKQQLTVEIEQYSARLKELAGYTTSSKPVVDEINNLLADTGFQGFQIQESPDKKNAYRIMYANNEPAEKLSEGERNFICFLYFYFTVMKTTNAENAKTLNDRVVVIDDPVSSMDGESVFVISALVRDMIEICLNAFTPDPDETIGTHIKQIFILTHNSFFYNEVAPLYVEQYNTTSYFEIRKENNISHVIPGVATVNKGAVDEHEINIIPQQSSYASLWVEYKKTQNPALLMGIMRRILEIYFLHDLGVTPGVMYKTILKNNRERFTKMTDADGKPITSAFKIASALLRYVSCGYTSSDASLYMTLSSEGIETYKHVFKELFYSMEQNQHYEMMMRRANG